MQSTLFPLRLGLALGLIAVHSPQMWADVVITTPTGGNNVSADKALNSTNGAAFTALGSIVITEAAATDFAVGNSQTLILTVPDGWQFNPGVGTVTFTGARNITAATLSVTASTLTVTFSVGGADKLDVLTIGGVQVQAFDGANVPGADHIRRRFENPGTAFIPGIEDDFTTFGLLNQVAGAARALAMQTEPASTANAGAIFAPQPEVKLVDQFGNLRNLDNTTVVTAARAAGSGTLQGTLTRTALFGVASYTNLSMNVAGTITIQFTAPGLVSVTSAPVVVEPAPADRLVFVTQPGSASAGVPFGIQPVLKTQDRFGSFSSAGLPASKLVTVTLSAGSGTLSGTKTLDIGSAAGNGTITFTDLQIDIAGSGKQLAATSSGLSNAVSTSFAVSSAVFSKLQLLVPGETAAPGTASGKTGTPNAQAAGTTFNVTVNAVDANWNLVNTIADTVALTSSDSNATLPANAALVSGTRTFSVTLNTVGSQTLTASDLTDGSKTANTSPTITVGGGTPKKLTIQTQPSTTATAGVPFAQQPVIRVEDAGGNLVATDNGRVITVARGAGTGTLQGTLTATTVNGLAAFNNLSYNLPETITLNFTATGLTNATSGNVVVSAGPFTKLQLLVPGETAAPGTASGKTGTPIAQTVDGSFPVTVRAVDALWNPIATVTDVVGITSSDLAATLPPSAALVAGLQTFNVALNTPGTATLTASDLSDGAKAANTSPAITVTAAQHTPATGGIAISADTIGGTFTTLNGPGYSENASGNIGTGTIILNAPAGFIFDTGSTAPTVLITRLTGSGANGNNLNNVASGTAAAITSRTTTQIVFTVTDVSVSGVTCKLTWQNVRVRPTAGTPLASGNLTRSGTATMVALFTNSNLGSLREVAGAAAKLTILTQPSASATAGVPFAQQPLLQVLDQFGNLRNAANGATNSTIVTASRNAGSGALQGTTNMTSVDGVVTFTNLAHNVATNITIAFSGSGLASTNSAAIAISPAAADHLVFAAQPGSAIYGSALSQQPVLKTQDAFGNDSSVGLGASKMVSLAVSAGSGTLLGATSLDIGTAAGNGLVSFSGLQVSAAGTGKQLTASASGLSSAVSSSFDISKATVSGSITANNKIYDGTTAATIATRSLSGVLGSDMVSLIGGTASFASKTVGTARTVTATGLSLSGADAANYQLGSTTATTSADITARALLVSATGVNKAYDGTSTATATLSDNRVAGDTLNASYSSASFDNKNVGVAKTVSVSGISLSGADAANYTANTTASTTADITARSLTVTATGVNKVYDGTTDASVSLAENRLAGDVLSASYTSASFANKNVGTAKTVSVSGISVSGADAGNYTANTSASATANISARALMVSATGVNKVYDGLTTATVTLSDDRLPGDDLSASYASGNFVNKNVGVVKNVSVSGIALSGADAANYAANTAASTTADITARSLNVTATGVNKVYDGMTTATVTLADNRVAGDSLTSSYDNASFADSMVGAAKTISVGGISLGGTDAANYTANTSTSTTADITTKALAVSGITANNKVYDANTVASLDTASAGLVGTVGGDDVSLNTAAAAGAFANKNAGTAKTVTVSGLSLSGADAANYSISQPTTTADITKAMLTVTADDQTRAAGQPNPTLTASYSGFVGGETLATSGVTGSPALSATTTNVAGSYPITIAAGTLSSGNYAFSFVNGALIVTPASASKLVFLSSPQSFTAGMTSGMLTVQRQDSYNNPNTTDGAITVSLSSDSTGLHAFRDSADTTTITSVSIASGASSASFKYTDPKAGTPTITVAKSGLTSATQAQTVNAGAFAKLQLLLPGETAASGTANGKTGLPTARVSGGAFNVTVNAVDQLWNVVSSASDTVALTSSDSLANLPASAALVGGTRNLNVTLNTVGSATLTASDVSDNTKLGNTSPAIAVTAGVATRLQVLLPGETAAPGTPTGKVGTPSPQTAGAALLNAVIVNAVDDNWNVAGLATNNVTITIADSNGTVADDNGAANGNMTLVSGTRTLSSLTFKTAGARTITATASGLASSTSASVVVNPAAFTRLQLLVPGETAAPGTVSGKTGTTSGQIVGSGFGLTVNAVDAYWNLVSTVNDTVGISSSDTTASLPSATALAAGTTNLTVSFNASGNFTLTAADITDGSKSSSTSPVIAVSPAQFTPATGGSAISADTTGGAWSALTGPTYTENSSGQVGTGTIILNAPSGFLFDTGGTVPTVSVVKLSGGGNNPVQGSVTSVTTTQIVYTVTVASINPSKLTWQNVRVRPSAGTPLASGSLTRGGTASVAGMPAGANLGLLREIPGAASGLAIQTQPSATATAGAAFAQQPLIKVQDQFGNLCTNNSSTVVSAARAAGSGTLQGTTNLTAVAGLVTFTNLSHKVATNITLNFSASGLSGTNSSVIAVSGAAADRLVFITQPGSAAYGSALSQQPVLKTQDSFGNDSTAGLGASKMVSLALTTGNGTLLGTTSLDIGTAAGNGMVSFSGLQVSAAGTGKQLTAGASGLASALSSSFDVTPVTVTGSITANNKAYDGTTAATIATRTLSGVLGGDNVSLNGGTASFVSKSVGSAKTVTASGLSLSGADAANYQLASTSASTTADITARPLVVSATGANRAYDGTSTATVTLSDNRLAGDSLTASYTGASFANKNVGTAKTVSVSGISLSGTDAANYTANTTASTTADITARSLSVTASGVNKVYDGTSSTTVTLSDNRLAGDSLTTSYTSASFANKNVGTAKTVSVSGISLSGDDAPNYTANTTASTSANISALALTVSAAGVSKVYDGTTTATATLSDDRLAGDSLSASFTSASFADKNVGTAKAVSVSGIALSGADAGNYTPNAAASTTADITTRALTISATGVNKAYDGTTTATVTLSDNRVAGDSLTSSYSSASFADPMVGAAKTVSVGGISLNGTDAANYTANTTASTTANITAATVSALVSVDNKVYDGTTSASIATRELNGVQGSDDVSLSGGSASFASKTAGTSKTVSVTGLSLSGADAANYQLASSSASTTADITARSLTVSATGINKVYNGTASSSVTLSDNRVAGDSLSTSYASASFVDKNVGTAKTVSVSGISVSGADAANYSANTSASAVADITVRSLAVTVTASNKVYDGTTDASVTLSDNRVAGDSLSTSHASASFANKNVGTAKIVSVSGISITGTDAANYSANTTASDTANITSKPLTVTGITADDKVYDATTSATLNAASAELVGVISGDTVTLNTGSASGAFANKNVGADKTVTISALSLSGADAANYSLTQPTTTASISKAGLTVTADNKTRAAGQSNPTLTASYSGFVGGETLATSGVTGSPALGTTTTNAAGTYPITAALGTLSAANYSFSFSNGTLTVSAASASKLVVQTQPSSTAVAGVAFAQQPQVRIEDAYGNLRSSDNSTVVTAARSSGNGTLQGTLSATAVNGVATFANLSHQVANTINLNFSASGMTGATSGNILVSPAAFAKLQLLVPGEIAAPGTASGKNGTPVSQIVGTGFEVNVNAVDAFWNVVTTADDSIGLTSSDATATLPSATALIAGTKTLTAFFNTNGNFTVTASDLTDAGKTPSTSPAIAVGPAQFTVATGGAAISADGATGTFTTLTGPTYTEDNIGEVGLGTIILNAPAGFIFDTAGTPPTVLSVKVSGSGNNPVQGSVTSFTTTQIVYTVTASSGNPSKLTWQNVRVRPTAGTPLMSGNLRRSGTASVVGLSTNVNLGTLREVAGAASSLVILTQPSATAAAGVPFAQQPVLEVVDQFGNLRSAANGVTSSTIVTAARLAGSGALQGTTSMSSVDGIVTFTNLSHNVAGNITLQFTAGSATATSDIIAVGGGSASRLVFATQPGSTTYGSALSSQPVLKTQDSFGNDSTLGLATSQLVSLTLTTGSGSLLGTTTMDIGTLAGNGTVSFSDLQVSAAGTGKQLTASASGLTSAVSSSFDVAPATVNGSITANSKIYDGTTAAMIAGRSLSGVLGSDDVSLSGGSASFASKSVGTAKTVTATGLSLSGADAANYQLASTAASTTADITGRSLTVSATGVNKVYNGTTSATVTLSDNRVAGDSLTSSYTSASFADKNVGSAKAVSVSGISISGSDAANYSANTTASTTANITARALTISATGVNRVYDATTDATVTLSDNRVAGDSLSTSYTSASFATKSAGANKTVSVSGISLTGTDAANYTFNSTTSTTANITARSLSVTATGSNKVYDGSSSATVTLADNRLAGDSLTTSYTSASFANKNVGPAKTVSVTGISLSGTDAANYSPNTTASTTADITARSLTVTATGVNKAYDGTTAATVTLSDNRVAGDSLTRSYASASFADKNVGTAKSVSADGIAINGTDAGNYQLASTTASTTANITAKGLTVTGITASNKVYDGNTVATFNLGGAALVGVVSGDDVSLNVGSTSGAFANKNVGTAKTVTVSGLSLSGADTSNYSLNPPSATADITKASLTVTADDKTRAAGQPNPTLTASYSGFVGAETQATSGITGSPSLSASSTNVAGNYPITITVGTLSSGNYSFTFVNGQLTVTPAAASKLVFTTSTQTLPAGTTSGTITVQRQDAYNNPNTADATITVNLSSSSTGTYTFRDVADTTTISSVTIASGSSSASFKYSDPKAGTPTISAASSGLTSATQLETVTAGAFVKLQVLVPGETAAPGTASGKTGTPTARSAGTAFNVTVRSVDANWNLVSSTHTVGIASSDSSSSLPANGALSAGTRTVSVTLNTPGTQTLTASDISDGTKTANTSPSITVNVGAASRLTVLTEPSSTATAGEPFEQQPVIQVEDAAGNLVTADNGRVITAVRSAGSGTLQGTVTATTVNGIATFANLSHNVATTISINFTASGLTSATSGSIFVDPAVASQLGFTTQPGGVSRTGSPLATQPVVAAQDAFGNTSSVGLPASLNVSLALTSGSGSLLGTTNVDIGWAAGDGMATFTNVEINDAGSNKVLTASAPGFSNAVSAAFFLGGVERATGGEEIASSTAGGAYTTLTGPAYYEAVNGDVTTTGSSTIILNAPSGFIFDTGGTAPTVRIDRLGGTGSNGKNINGVASGTSVAVTSRTSTQITFTVTSDSSGGVTCSLTWQNIRVRPSAASPLASGNLTKTGTSSLPAVTNSSTSFGQLVEFGPAARLVIQTQPSSTATAGVLFGQQPVLRIEDAAGHFLASDNSTVVTAARSAGSGTLQGTTSRTAVNGVVTFTNLSHNVATNITIQFTSGSLTSTTSTAIAVSPAAASQLVYTTQPANGTYGSVLATQPVIRSRDQFGNNSTVGLGANQDVTVALSSGTGPLLGTTTMDIGTAAGNGIIAFTDLRIDSAGSNKQLTASASGLGSAISSVFSVAKKDQAIVLGSLASKTYGDAPFTVSATASSGLPVSFSIVSGPATIAGNVVTITGAGAVTVRASQSGDDEWNAAPNVNQSFTVAPKLLTPSITANNKIYDGTTAATIATRTLSGVVGSDNVSLIGGTAAFANKSAGAGKTVTATGLSLSGASASNYQLASTSAMTTADINPKNLTVTGVSANNKVYDGTTTATLNAASAALVGKVSGDDVTLNTASAAGAFADANVGTAKPVTVSGLALSGLDAGNYTLTQPSSTANITVKGLTVAGITAGNKVYDGTTTATLNVASAALAGQVSGDDVTLNTASAAGVFANANVGTAKPVTVSGLTLGGAAADNYSLTQPAATADITSATLTANISVGNKIYDGSTAATITARTLSGVVGSDDVSLSGGTATFADKNLGAAKTVTVTGLSLSGADAGNYQLASTTTSTTADITARTLTVSATGANKVYDGTSAATVTLSDGRVAGDTLSASYASASFADKLVGLGKTISVSGISVSGLDAVNYSANTTASATADITAKGLAVSGVIATNKVYDGTTSAAITLDGATWTGLVSGDDVSLSTNSVAGTFASATAETNKLVTVSGLILEGADAGQYILTPTTTTADITPAPLFVVADDKTKVYGEANPPLTANYVGFVNGEDASVLSGSPDLSTPVTTETPEGFYPITVALGSLSATNYTFNFQDGQFTVMGAAPEASTPSASGEEAPAIAQPAVLTGIQVVPNGIKIRFTGSAGQTYQIVRASELLNNGTVWTIIGSATTDAAGNGEFTDIYAPASHSFYRAVSPESNPQPAPAR